jgi:hypothetical protein
VQDSAFKDDIVNFKMTVRGSGYEAGKQVKLTLKDKKTGAALRTADGRPAETVVTLQDGKPVEEEILFKPESEGPLDIVAEAEKQPGELDPDDNTRTASVSILDAKISVLYVDGYPRWEYRYVKNEMIRDKSVQISCLLTSADPSFAQEGDPASEKFPGPIRRFPESIPAAGQHQPRPGRVRRRGDGRDHRGVPPRPDERGVEQLDFPVLRRPGGERAVHEGRPAAGLLVPAGRDDQTGRRRGLRRAPGRRRAGRPEGADPRLRAVRGGPHDVQRD